MSAVKIQSAERRRQARTQFSLWAVMAAPLLIGADLMRISPWDLETLTNAEVLGAELPASADMLRIRGSLGWSALPSNRVALSGGKDLHEKKSRSTVLEPPPNPPEAHPQTSEVIAIDQDELGIQGAPVWSNCPPFQQRETCMWPNGICTYAWPLALQRTVSTVTESASADGVPNT